MSEELFEFLDTGRFFNHIDVSKKDGCGEYTIISCLDNEISDFFHDRVIDKRGWGNSLVPSIYFFMGYFWAGLMFLEEGGS